MPHQNINSFSGEKNSNYNLQKSNFNDNRRHSQTKQTDLQKRRTFTSKRTQKQVNELRQSYGFSDGLPKLKQMIKDEDYFMSQDENQDSMVRENVQSANIQIVHELMDGQAFESQQASVTNSNFHTIDKGFMHEVTKAQQMRTNLSTADNAAKRRNHLLNEANKNRIQI